MDPFEAATKETENFSSDGETETQSTTSDASEPFRMADPSLTNMSKAVDDEEEEEEEENMDVVFRNMSTATSGDDPDKQAKKKEIMSQLTEDQMERYEFFRRSRFKKVDMRRLLIGITGVKTISEPMIVAVSATTKLFVGDIVETESLKPFESRASNKQRNDDMMTTSMAFIQHVCSTPFARAVRVRSLAANTVIPSQKLRNLSSTTATALTTPSSSSRAHDNDSRVLLGLSETDLQQLAVDLGQQSYRGKQLHHFIYQRKVRNVEDFTLLPKAFRNELLEAGWRVGRSPIYQSVTAPDGTVKLLIKLEDNRLIETVGIPVKDDKGSMRLTACVSSQVGCPLRCSFCATGKGGFSRNLRAHEIVEQVLAIEETFKHRVKNVVFMGMGEPMLNMKAVLEAHRCLNKDIEIGQRMITISTVGVPNTIKRLASHKLQSTLAISLHAPNQKLREAIVPSAKAYPLEAIMEDCKNYFLETSRRVTFEYALLAGVNDTVEHATELAELLHQWGRGYHVNLIPFNPIEGSEYKRPSKKAASAFAAALESRKITASIRQTRGLEANAACGQLRNKFQKSPLVLDSDNVPSQSEVVIPSQSEVAIAC